MSIDTDGGTGNRDHLSSVASMSSASCPAARAFHSPRRVMRYVWMCSGARSSSAKIASSWRALSASGCATSRSTVRSLCTMRGPSAITFDSTGDPVEADAEALCRGRAGCRLRCGAAGTGPRARAPGRGRGSGGTDVDDARDGQRALDVGAAVAAAQAPAAETRRLERERARRSVGEPDGDLDHGAGAHRLLELA